MLAQLNALPALHLSRRSLAGRLSERLQSPPLCYGDGSQSASGEELRPHFGRMLMPNVLDKAVKGEL